MRCSHTQKGPRDESHDPFYIHLMAHYLVLYIRHQCQMSCTLDRHCERSLVLRAVSGDPSGKNLTSLGDVSPELIAVLVIDHIILTAEYTNLLSSAHASLCLREIRPV